MNDILKKSYPYILTVLLFFVLASAYFPLTFQGKVVEQHDKKTWAGMAQEVNEFKKETGETSLWTNSMFGGMPTYLINLYSPSNYTKYVDKIFQLDRKMRPISFALMYFLGFYIALLAFKFNKWESLIGAIAFGLSSYFFIIIQAGHITKAVTIGYMPPIIAGVYLAYNGKRVLGTVIMALFLGLQLLSNHLQITYYTMMIIIPLVVVIFIDYVKEKRMADFMKSTIILGIGLLIVIGANFESLYTTYDYGKYTTRSKSELTNDISNKTSGLDRDYATSWSYGKMETFNLLIPDLYGGASGGELTKDSETYEGLKNIVGESKAKDIIKRYPLYWGPQPMTSGPVYIGALVVFLFIMGLFLVKGYIRSWIIFATILSITLAWGKNFMGLTDFFFDFVPGYNKFRTVSMTLVMAEFTIPLLGIFALRNIVSGKVSKDEVMKALKYSVGIVASIIVIFLINPGILDFSTGNERDYFASMFGLQPGQGQEILDTLVPALISDRESIFRSDAIRSLVIILFGAGTIWLFIKDKLSKKYLYIFIALIILFDLWGVDKRYMNDSHFIAKRKADVPFKPTMADNYILQDKSLDFRVLNVGVSTFNDASTAYFHKSIGGYHGAKMKRYQELIDFNISNEMNSFFAVLRNNPNQMSVENGLKSLQVLNMLNTKYIIYNGEAQPILNNHANGNAWFVNDVKIVEDADAEIAALKTFNSKTTAVVDKRFSEYLVKANSSSTSTIELTSYKPNEVRYNTNTVSEQIAVFSEIYYDKGWNAYVDGKLTPHFRANYILRAMHIPNGNHEITFKFEPESNVLASISSISSILLILLVLGVLFGEITNNKLVKKFD